jgi:shikimate dehydrogenase
MHQAAYAALGLDWEYGLYPCESQEDFFSLVDKATDPASGFLGLNVTMPYKTCASRACARQSAAARLARSVNVMTFEPSGSLGARSDASGANTDGVGVVRFLKDEAVVEFASARVLLCGTGPTAAAIAVALRDAGAESVSVLSRDAARATELMGRIGHAGATGNYADAALVRRLVAECTVVIDATPLGMQPHDGSVIPVELLGPSHTVLDVVYGHGVTALVAGARERGAQAYDGLGMLVEQAALTIELWAAACGLALVAPRGLMRQAATGALPDAVGAAHATGLPDAGRAVGPSRQQHQ